MKSLIGYASAGFGCGSTTKSRSLHHRGGMTDMWRFEDIINYLIWYGMMNLGLRMLEPPDPFEGVEP